MARFALVIGLAAAAALGACQKAASPANTAVANSAPAAAPAAADSADAAAAKAFLEGLYAHYKTYSATQTTWAPMDANVKEVFDPDMVALLAADTKALKGELGEIDGDWICDCQDWGSLAATVTITSASPTAAKAVADFHDTQVADAKPRRDTFDLVKTADGWRIHDMGTADQPSLRAVLTKEIADLKSGKGKPQSDSD
jgi:hypothetical protein